MSATQQYLNGLSRDERIYAGLLIEYHAADHTLLNRLPVWLAIRVAFLKPKHATYGISEVHALTIEAHVLVCLRSDREE